jgi:rubredoxin
MAVPKNLKGKVSLLALKEAAGEDMPEMDMDAEKAEEYTEKCVCPKCGHSGSKEDFETEME